MALPVPFKCRSLLVFLNKAHSLSPLCRPFCTRDLQQVGAALGFAGTGAANTPWLLQKRRFTFINYKRVR